MLVRQHLAMAPYNNSYSMVPMLSPTSHSERFCEFSWLCRGGIAASAPPPRRDSTSRERWGGHPGGGQPPAVTPPAQDYIFIVPRGALCHVALPGAALSGPPYVALSRQKAPHREHITSVIG